MPRIETPTLTSEMRLHAYDRAYYIWYYFAAIGFCSGLALMTYSRVTKARETDAKPA